METTCVKKLGLLLLLAAAGSASAKDYLVFYLGGQSNMDGYGYTAELSGEDATPVDGVMIFHGNRALDGEPDGGLGLWAPLRPGHGTGFKSDGVANIYSDRFGPELSLGRRLKTQFPDHGIALIKYSLGGSGLADGVGYGNWAPDFDGTNQYDFALKTLRLALSVHDIDGDGESDRLIPAGIVWMQGETDAYQNYDATIHYETNLKRLMDLLRAALRVDDLPVVIGKITDSGMAEDGSVMDHAALVQKAQQRFAETDACAAFSTITDELAYPADDPWHYNSLGYLLMGADFADHLQVLAERCGHLSGD